MFTHESKSGKVYMAYKRYNVNCHMADQAFKIFTSWWASVYVCPRAYLQSHTYNLYQLFCACCIWLWLGPLPAGWQNPKRKGASLRVFLFTDNALYSRVFGTHTKNGWTDRHAILDEDSGALKQLYYMEVQIPERERVIFGSYPGYSKALAIRCRICCKRDHSTANNVMQQKRFSMPRKRK